MNYMKYTKHTQLVAHALLGPNAGLRISSMVHSLCRVHDLWRHPDLDIARALPNEAGTYRGILQGYGVDQVTGDIAQFHRDQSLHLHAALLAFFRRLRSLIGAVDRVRQQHGCTAE